MERADRHHVGLAFAADRHHRGAAGVKGAAAGQGPGLGHLAGDCRQMSALHWTAHRRKRREQRSGVGMTWLAKDVLDPSLLDGE